jgi:hypothetical protein
MRARPLAASASLVISLTMLTAACSSGNDANKTSGRPGTTASTTPTTRTPSAVRTPTVSTPTATGKGIQAIATDMDFASVGYVREEYFLEGDADGYKNVGQLTPDGKWTVAVSKTAPYKTRMVVIRPKDAADFNGTVWVEWFNVTGGLDAPAAWISGHNQVIRSGAAWVGVTAQAGGVDGEAHTVQSKAIAIPQGGLVKSDPVRYGTLHHPGDLFSYDIFTQAGVAIRGNGKGVRPLQGFDVKRLIAIGQSQSAGRLTTYVDAVQPVAGVYDGVMLFSRGATPAPLGERLVDGNDPTIPAIARIRTDVTIPVFTFETEYDVSVLKYADARQPDSSNFRLWEVAGTSHEDSYSGGGYALTDLGNGAAEAAVLNPAKANGGLLNCAEPMNAGAMHAVLAAAMSDLDGWVRDGTAPPEFPLVNTTGHGDEIKVVRNSLGIAQGGIRTPIVDVPLAANIGDATNSPDFCRVFGRTQPFDAATLQKLYPRGKAQYVEEFDRSADKALEAGVWLPPEAKNFKAAARQVSFD